MSGRERSSSQIVDEVLAAHAGRPGALLPILHDLQHALGWVSDAAVAQVALALNLSRADVHGVVTFYHDFRHELPGRHILKLCRAEACQSRGGVKLAEHVQARLRIQWRQTTPDRRFTLEPVFCLGLCATAPAAMLNGKVLGRVAPAQLDDLIEVLNGAVKPA